jgi:hypothetical protein
MLTFQATFFFFFDKPFKQHFVVNPGIYNHKTECNCLTSLKSLITIIN